jgi:ABC-type transport system involved in Fe-S cluster assembly fused permease/ATPase subunit
MKLVKLGLFLSVFNLLPVIITFIVICIYIFLTLYVSPSQESWANDLNQVRELMTTFIDDTMRKTNDPEFTVSEVGHSG